MSYSCSETTTIHGDLASIWKTASDVASWGAWDPHVLSSGFDDAPFEVGAGGWTVNRMVSSKASHFKLIAVEPGKKFTSRSPMPLGKMLITNEYAPAGDGRIKVTRTAEVFGPMAPLFKRIWAKDFRADSQKTFEALESEAARRQAETSGSR
jgi:hypothetical protein